MLVSGKSNLCREVDGLAFSIEGDPPAVCWQKGTVRMSADEACEIEAATGRKRGPEAVARKEAEMWLRDALANGPRPTPEVLAEAAKVGFKEGVVRHAKAALNVVAKKADLVGGWTWRLPDAEDGGVSPY